MRKKKIVCIMAFTCFCMHITACTAEVDQVPQVIETVETIDTEESIEFVTEQNTIEETMADTQEAGNEGQDDNIISLRQYLDQHVAHFQKGEAIGKQNGEVFHERGYSDYYLVTYDLCGRFYYGADVMFCDERFNTIILDFVSDEEIPDLNKILLTMEGDLISSAYYEEYPERVYTFTYDDQGTLIEYTDDYVILAVENTEEGTNVYRYQNGDIRENYMDCWSFDDQGIFYEATHIEGSGITCNIFSYEGDEGFRYVSEVIEKDCMDEEAVAYTFD